MTDSLSQPPRDLSRQVWQHIQSLQAAGVDWLPVGAPLVVAAAVHATSQESARSHEAAEPQRARPPAATDNDRPRQLFDEAPEPSTAPTLSWEEKRVALQVLSEEVAQCTRCAELVVSRSRTVFGVGDPNAELCFVGEAPGYDEDRQGEPFVGQAGQLLNRIIAACGMKRAEVYICNVLRCRPPGNRTPLPHEVANCRPFLERTLAIVRPRFICALGACAAQTLLHTTQGISRLRGRLHSFQGVPVLCTYHPAYLLRNPAAKRDVWEDMKFLLQRMGRPIPGGT
ncbi:MAG: uracil-DNA glycosylase family protein [Gemmataceae bacterium]